MHNDYEIAITQFLEKLRAIKAPIRGYREAIALAIDELEMELESLGDPDADDLDADEGDSR